MGSQHPYNFTGEDVTNAPVGFDSGGVVTPVTIASSAALTALQTGLSIPPSGAIAGAVYQLRGWGNYSVTGTPTLTFAGYLGGITGTALAAMPAITAGTGVTNCLFDYDLVLSFTDSTHAESVLALHVGTSSTTDAASSFVASPTSATTVAVTSAKALTMGFTWSASSASNTITLRGGYCIRVA